MMSKLLKRGFSAAAASSQGKPFENSCPAVSRLSSLVFESARGSWVTLEGGKKMLDFCTGFGVTNTGHCHPKVVKAAQDQLGKIMHCQIGIGYHRPLQELMKRLLTVVPGGLDGFLFLTSGAEAVENAMKLARHATGKQNIICFQGGYHGRTYGAMSLTTSKTCYRAHFGPFPSGVIVTPFPYASQLPHLKSGYSMTDYCIEQIELVLKQQSMPSETAAIIVEPVLGEGGYVVPPSDFLPRLQKLCRDNKIMFIADEVQTGYGRTGKMFACEHWGLEPDILIFAKGVASGLPLAGIASKLSNFAKLPPGSMGGTYSGNAVPVAAAVATFDVFQEEKLVENSRVRGEQLTAGLKKIQATGKYPIKDIRGLGLMVGIEFEKSHPGIAGKISKHSLEEGMLLLNTSTFDTIRFIPPLTVTSEEIELGLKMFQRALDKSMQK